MNTKVKKIVKLAAAGLFILALAINVKVTLDDPFVMLSEQAIATGSSGGGGSGVTTDDCTDGCIPNDCPWWNPFCDEWLNADPVDSIEYPHPLCTRYITDCYPGTKTCTEKDDLVCL